MNVSVTLDHEPTSLDLARFDVKPNSELSSIDISFISGNS
jgi:hypothetical protein